MNTAATESKYNSQTTTRFTLTLPLASVLGESDLLRDFRLNVTNVSTPEIIIGATEESWQGYEIPMPNGNRMDAKLLTVEFIVDELLTSYAAMLAWINKITPAHSVGENEKPKNPMPVQNMVDGTLDFLDNYLKPVSYISYEQLWIVRLGELRVDQTDQTGRVLKCDVSFRYFRSYMPVFKMLGL